MNSRGADTGRPRFEVETGRIRGIAVLRPRGMFDAGCAGAIEEKAASIGEGQGLILNLSGVEYLSSSGIGEIVFLASRFRLVLASLSEGAARLLSLAEVLPLLSVAADEEAAEMSLR